ncbi:MAG: pilP [Bacteriovoracaceae bacterium]|nr:pilP [Bacteriovoracaceae bacterium]
MTGLSVLLAFFLGVHATPLSKDTDLPKDTKPTAGATQETLAPPPVAASDAMTYTYNPFGKRDPFRSFLSEKGSKVKDSRDPLLNFDLTKFALTGILWGISNPKAIVVDGEGHGHVISRGTRIGRNKGQVIRILKEEVVVAEEYRDPLGKLLVTEHTLKMTSKDELK